MENRLEAARQLERVGWCVVRYAQRVQRACEEPSVEHEESAKRSLLRFRELWAAFKQIRGWQ